MLAFTDEGIRNGCKDIICFKMSYKELSIKEKIHTWLWMPVIYIVALIGFFVLTLAIHLNED